MVGQGTAVNVSSVVIAAVFMMSCSSPSVSTPTSLDLRSTAPIITIPPDVLRMAIVYPRGEQTEWAGAYSRLEGAAFQLKAYRPTLRIIDRSHMPAIVTEQRFQVGGLVSDESAIRIGQMLGVDSVLIYRIEGPTLRDRIWARRYRDLPPVTVTSKIVRVESAEVVYHNVVAVRAEAREESGWSLSDNVDVQQWGREALDRGIAQTLVDLHRAFE